LRLRDEIWELLTQRNDERVFSNSVDSLAYAHMAVDGLTSAVMRLASEIDELQARSKEADGSKNSDLGAETPTAD
jgi:hypothetical protein